MDIKKIVYILRKEIKSDDEKRKKIDKNIKKTLRAINIIEKMNRADVPAVIKAKTKAKTKAEARARSNAKYRAKVKAAVGKTKRPYVRKIGRAKANSPTP